MRLSYVSTATILVGLLGVSGAFAQNIPAELTRERTERREAGIKGDRTTYDKLTADSYISVDATGRVENKAQRLARVVPPANAPQGAIAPPDRLNEHITMYNNDTVIFFWQQVIGQNMQNAIETWVKEGGQWKCAASHFSIPVPTDGGAGAGGRKIGWGESPLPHEIRKRPGFPG